MGPDIVSLDREWLTDIAPIASRKNSNSGLTSGNEDGGFYSPDEDWRQITNGTVNQKSSSISSVLRRSSGSLIQASSRL